MSEPTPLDNFEPIDDLELPVSLPSNRSTPVVIVDKAKYLAMQQRIQELEAGYEARGKTIDAMTEDIEALMLGRTMMSEPLWSMDKWWHEVQQVKGTAQIAGNNVDYMELADAEELSEKIIADYEQRIHELEAELARLREQQWEPLPDGRYEVRKYDARLYVSWPAPLRLENGIMTTPSIYTGLPDDIALCRKVDAQPKESNNHE